METRQIPREVIAALPGTDGARPRTNRAAARANQSRSRAASSRSRPHGLNEGELAVLFLMLQGEYAREIAGYLALPLAEVESRQLSIRAKMGARSATEAAVLAIKQQIFPNTRPPLRLLPR